MPGEVEVHFQTPLQLKTTRRRRRRRRGKTAHGVRRAHLAQPTTATHWPRAPSNRRTGAEEAREEIAGELGGSTAVEFFNLPPTTHAFCILKFAQHSRPQETMRTLPCCAVAVTLHAHMQLIVASPYEFSWQLFNIFVFTLTFTLRLRLRFLYVYFTFTFTFSLRLLYVYVFFTFTLRLRFLYVYFTFTLTFTFK